VIYMGVTRLSELQRGLLTALPGATPAAVVQDVGLAGERQAVTTLAALADEVAAQGFGSPAILIVGDVLRARASGALAVPRAA
jgi:uroporphyrin-III C-methyltransferase